MKLLDFLNDINFDEECLTLYAGTEEIFKNDLIYSEDAPEIKITTDIEGYISIIQGETVVSFHPETITYFRKQKKYKFKK